MQIGPSTQGSIGFPGLARGTYSDITRQKLPTSPADAHAGNCRIHRLLIFNNGPGNADVTVHDKQVSPIAIVPDQTLPVGGIIDLTSEIGEFCTSGFTWSASTANVVGSGVIEA